MPAQCDASGQPIGAGHFADGVGGAGLGFTCQGCHTLSARDGFFGTDGQLSFEALPQTNKIPQLRNLYTKVGMFGVAPVSSSHGGATASTGAQIRGFGFTNDGSVDTLFEFLQARVFDNNQRGRIGFAGGDAQRRDVEQFLLASTTTSRPSSASRSRSTRATPPPSDRASTR